MNNKLKAGFAKAVITPPVGAYLQGYFHPRCSEGIHDDLYAKAMVLADGNTEIALVSCDLLGVSGEIVSAARRLIEKSCGISQDNVMICATHIHSGPATAQLDYVPEEQVDRVWIEILERKIAGAAQMAKGNMRDARIGVGLGSEDSIIFNRRYRMRDGMVLTNPGRGNPEIVGPVGPVDPDVRVMKVEDLAGNLMGLFVNYANHVDVVGGLFISADYPGYMARAINKVYGNEVSVMFTNGAFGDVNHIDVKNHDQKAGYEEAERMGTILAGDVISVAEKISCSQDYPIKVRREIVALPMKQIAVPETAKGLMAEEEIKSKPSVVEAALARKHQIWSQCEEKIIAAELQAITLGNAVLTGIPGELFVELGMKLKQNSVFEHTFVISLANDYIGYIPTAKAFEEGSYESTFSPLAAGAGEMLIERALKLMAD